MGRRREAVLGLPSKTGRGVWAMLGALLVLAGCEQESRPIRIDFTRRVQIASVRAGPNAADAIAQGPLRVGVGALLSPTRNLEVYHDLLTYIGRRLGRKVQLYQRGTYADINELLKHHELDLAFVCGGALVAGERDFGMEVLAVPEIRGKPGYYSYLIVSRRSGIARLEDLRGRSFAFSDPLSNSGRLAIVHQLMLRGEMPEHYFGRTMFTYSHDNSILAVADGLVDGAAVDSLVYDYLRIRHPTAVSETQVIARWGPYGAPPVAVHPEIEPALRSALSRVLLSMHAEPEGKKILGRLMIDRFVEPTPDLFRSIRDMESWVAGR